MSKKSEQGKYAEKKVREFLKKVSASRANFVFDRIPDARSSRGRSGQRPSDFAAFTLGTHAWIEPKEISHTHLLPKKNVTQIPMLRLRKMAGGVPIIVVYHSINKVWRCPPFEFFEDNQGETGSFDLQDYPIYKTVAHALGNEYPEIFQIRSLR